MDYSTTEIDPYWAMPCKCNGPSCRKVIRPFQSLPIELRRIYSTYMLETLLADVPSEDALLFNPAARCE
jgi:hypothetical protein